MAVTEKSTERRAKVNIWSVNVRQVVYMALGAALYGGLSLLTSIIPVPSAGNVSFRPGIVIPLFFGAVFGPVVGLFVGLVGNILVEIIYYKEFFWNWDVGNALIGFIAGLAVLVTYGRYNKTRAIVIAEIFSAIAIIIGIGFSSYSEMYVSKLSFITATVGYFVSAGGTDLINGLILLPILLVAYNAAVTRRGRG